MKCIALAVAVLLAVCHVGFTYPTNDKVSYQGYKVFNLNIENENQRNFLIDFIENNNAGDFNSMDILVDPKTQMYFQNATMARGFRLKEIISNLQSLIDEEKPYEGDDSEEFNWTRYYELEDIYKFLDDILAKYPKVTEPFTIAQSYEGRTVRGIKISLKEGNPGIYIESNIHAREWITSATATWFINELLTSTDPEVRNLVENYDWYIVPVLNVDGFTYSHNKDRLWRKTRQPVAHSTCIGTDGNRNFDSYWMVNGASSNPCASDYAGPQANSEPEIKGESEFLSANKDKFNILLAFHCYSQMLLSPYGHTLELPPNNDDLEKVADAYAKAVINMPYKTEYTYGTSAGAMYYAPGSTIDFAYNEADIKITYTIEMRDTGLHGFVLPPTHILPNCKETMAGIVALVKEAENLGYMKPKYL
ncbi:zinc carboxypeptidase-like [Musca vetustissima]|uniref:zinc carboxypeptidase-like n=1 Tax=Musca vetustissima TaxID=27455 RepID=UPI002AB7725E|nr:zinc carboxypeptidase-like [Musca vetustissima]